MTLQLRIVSVNTGRPRIIGQEHGEPVFSAFVKTPVQAATIRVNSLALDGDECADPINHGGVHCAVYAYPSDHWSWWEREHNFACAPARFGENLTTEGADEAMVAIGDRFQWGDAVLEVSQPRRPCFKFQMASARNDVSALMTLSGRCGWYFRIVQPGSAPVQNAALIQISESGGPSVREVFVARANPRLDASTRLRLAAAPALTPGWREWFARGLA